MSDLLAPELLDARLDQAAQALRTDDPVALNRIVDRSLAPVSRSSRVPMKAVRLGVGALTVALAGVALYPWGKGAQAEANLGFAQVREATQRAPHSIARNFDANGKPSGFTVWREGKRYASELWSRGHERMLSETRSDGTRTLHSFQWSDTVEAPGYRFASLGLPSPAIESQFDTLEGILRTYMVKGPEPVAERVGDRLRYKIRPIWAKTETMTVEADATTGRVLEIRSPGGRTVLDYETPIPAGTFRLRPSDPDIVVLDTFRLRSAMKADVAAGAGAWLTGDGALWRVYRGSVETPPAIAGLRLRGRTISKALMKDGVVAVGSTPDRMPPAVVRISGKIVPVRKVGMIYWWRSLFGPVRP